jgi:hypothetical protein
VVLEGLVSSEVVTITFSEAVLAVDLELAFNHGVEAADIGLGSCVIERGSSALEPSVGVSFKVIPLIDTIGGGSILTDSPDQFHTRVVECELGAVS